MARPERCPICGEDEVGLYDPAEEDWLDPADYDEDAEVWACAGCTWSEEADPDDALEEHLANLEWLEERLRSK